MKAPEGCRMGALSATKPSARLSARLRATLRPMNLDAQLVCTFCLCCLPPNAAVRRKKL